MELCIRTQLIRQVNISSRYIPEFSKWTTGWKELTLLLFDGHECLYNMMDNTSRSYCYRFWFSRRSRKYFQVSQYKSMIKTHLVDSYQFLRSHKKMTGMTRPYQQILNRYTYINSQGYPFKDKTTVRSPLSGHPWLPKSCPHKDVRLIEIFLHMSNLRRCSKI